MGNIEEIAPKIWSVDDNDDDGNICSNVDEDYEDDDAIVNICKQLIRVDKNLIIRVIEYLIRVNKHLIDQGK